MIRVMIVDDHPTLVWGLGQLIATQTHMQVVATAGRPEEAVEEAQRSQPQLVLLDLDLDGRSGLDLLPALSRPKGCKVLVLTAERQLHVLDQAVQLGASGVLSKDASADTVIKAIEKVHQGEVWLDRLSMARMLHGWQHKPTAERARQASLTARERKIVQVIPEHASRNHLSAIYHTLGVSNRMELYLYASKHRLGQNDSVSGDLFAG